MMLEKNHLFLVVGESVTQVNSAAMRPRIVTVGSASALQVVQRSISPA